MAEEATPQSNSATKNFLNKKTLKIALIAVVVLILALGVYFLKGEFVAALVNGQPVSRLEVIETLEKQNGKQALETIITKTLIRQEAKKQGVKVTQDELDAKIAEIQTNLMTQGITLDQALKEQSLTQDDLKEELIVQVELEKLVPQGANVSDEEIKQFITQNEINETEVNDETREQIRSQITQQKRSADIDSLITKLKQEADIQYFKNY